MATIFSGGTYVNTTFVGSTKADQLLNMRDQLVLAGWTNVPLAAGQGAGNVGAVTISIANPAVVNWPGHGFLGNEKVVLQTTGALPGSLNINYVYYVKYIDANNFNLATSPGGGNIATSGSQSGVHTMNTQYVLLQSATQAYVANPIRVKLQDNLAALPGYIGVSIQNQAGTVVGSNNGGGNITPTLQMGPGKTWRIIATKYHFLCFTPAPSGSREFVMAGMVCVPSFLTGINDQGYVMGSGYSEADTSMRACMRNCTSTSQNYVSQNGLNVQLIWNGAYYENAYSWNTPGGCQYIFMNTGNYDSLGRNSNYRWANDQLLTSDVLLSSCLTTSASEEAKIKGQFFDLVYIGDAFAGDVLDSFNGHPWFNVTQNNTGGSFWPRGGFWVATA
jgi:hypothetical protein